MKVKKRNMNYFGCLWNSLREVYSEKKYYLISIISTLLIYIANAMIHNNSILRTSFSWKLLYSLVVGFHKSVAFVSIGLLIILSVFSGILISMSIFLVKRQVKSGIYASSGGIIMSIIAPACSSCALGVLSMIGLGGFLAVLPFKGLEIGLIGLLFVVFSLFYLGKKIETKICSV